MVHTSTNQLRNNFVGELGGGSRQFDYGFAFAEQHITSSSEKSILEEVIEIVQAKIAEQGQGPRGYLGSEKCGAQTLVGIFAAVCARREEGVEV